MGSSAGRYYIATFGCQMNKADSEKIAGDYQARGYQEAADWKNADEIVINTCSVRKSAEDRVVGFLRNVSGYFSEPSPGLVPALRIRRKPKIILTGCMTYHGEKELKKNLPMLDAVLPPGEIGFNQIPVRKNETHAWVPISQGCNSFCSYCVVPYSRGREKSRPMNEIINEVKNLSTKGCQEITLLGQNVNSYGLEKIGIGFRKLLLNNNFTRSQIPLNQPINLEPGVLLPFVKLLRRLSKIKKITKISFLTSNPWDFRDDLIEEIARNSKIDRYIHLPAQSGSNRILKLMNRGYTRSSYLKLVGKLRQKIPGVVMGTDIIVGFPTESEQDFQDTVSLAKKAGWAAAFVARYSPRPGTAAERLYRDDVSAEIKKKRWEILDKIINKGNLKARPKFR